MSDEKLEILIVESEIEQEDEYIEEDYNEYDEEEPDEDDDEMSERNVAADTWDLSNSLNLAREAADWYLLMGLWLDMKDEGKFKMQTTRLAKMFSNYADMVIGGELRYTLSHIDNADETLSDELQEHLTYNMNGVGRGEAWESWYCFRQAMGTPALRMAEDAFQAFGDSSSYGGPKWAYIVRTLRMYEEAEITPTTFVDMCWGLEHNGGQFFGKLWSTFRLQTVLDANVQENMPDLFRYADPEITKLYVEVA